MPNDDERSQQIEKRIDPNIAAGIALIGSGGTMAIAPQNVPQMFEFAKMMAVSGACVRPAFRGNPGACLAIAMQAFRTGFDPFAVANKAYITKSKATGDEQIAYESQYIHAVINTSGKLAKRLRATYSGEGPSRKCTIIGHIVGEDEPLPYESPTIGSITVKNSPLWQSDPDQQLFYYATRAWCRRWLPEVTLGMYTPDEFRGEVIDIPSEPVPPRPQREDCPDPEPDEDFADEKYGFAVEGDAEEPASDPKTKYPVVDLDGVVEEKPTAEEAADAFVEILKVAARRGKRHLDGVWQDNSALLVLLERDDAAALRVVMDAYDCWPREGPDRPKDEPLVPRQPTAEAPARREDSESTRPAPSAPEPVIIKATGKPDYRGWALLLFMKAVNQQKTKTDLDQLLATYDHHIQAFKRAHVPDIARFNGYIAEAYGKLPAGA